MKILITGANGQVGSEIVRLGKSRKYDVDGTLHQQLDISNSDSVMQYVANSSPDIVINAAAYTAVDKAEDEKALAFAINSDGPANLSSACRARNIPLFHISTDYVFDGEKKTAYTETDIPNPQSVYGRSKLSGEKQVSKWQKHIILRVAWVFGKQGNNFVKSMLKLAANRDELNIVDDQTGAPTWSVDIANVLLDICDRYREDRDLPWGIYHFTGRPSVTWYDFSIEIFNQASNLGIIKKAPVVKPITSDEYPMVASRPLNSVLSGKKIQEKFGIIQADWRIGLEKVVKNWEHV